MAKGDNNGDIFPFPTLLVDESVYGLTAQGRIISVFQTYEDAVNTLSSVRKEHPDILIDEIIRIPVTQNLNDGRMKLSAPDQRQLLNNAHQLTANHDLDSFNHRYFEQEQSRDYQNFYLSVRRDWRRLGWTVWLVAACLLIGILLGTESWMTKAVANWMTTGLGIVAMAGLIGLTMFADYRSKKELNKIKSS